MPGPSEHMHPHGHGHSLSCSHLQTETFLFLTSCRTEHTKHLIPPFGYSHILPKVLGGGGWHEPRATVWHWELLPFVPVPRGCSHHSHMNCSEAAAV